MKFSVIIPAYNAKHTIKRAVNSCLQQSMLPLEIIVVDDASNDETQQVLNKLNNPLIRIITLKENMGTAYARNKGWEIAKGDFVAFLDADDEWHLDKLKICHQYLNESVNILWHNFTYGEWDKLNTEKLTLQKTPFSSLMLSNPVSTCTMVFGKDIPIRFDPTMRYCEDHDLILRATYHYEVFHLPLALTKVHRRINSKGGLSGNRWQMRKGELKMYQKLGQLHPSLVILTPILWIFSLLKYATMNLRN